MAATRVEIQKSQTAPWRAGRAIAHAPSITLHHSKPSQPLKPTFIFGLSAHHWRQHQPRPSSSAKSSVGRQLATATVDDVVELVSNVHNTAITRIVLQPGNYTFSGSMCDTSPMLNRNYLLSETVRIAINMVWQAFEAATEADLHGDPLHARIAAASANGTPASTARLCCISTCGLCEYTYGPQRFAEMRL